MTGLAWKDGKPGTLRKALWDIRAACRGTDCELIEAFGSSLRLGERISCDLHLLNAGDNVRDPGLIYRGEFLDYADDFDHPPWVGWLDQQRSRFRSIYVAQARAILAQSHRPGASPAREASRLLEVDRTDEAATRVRMLAEASSGNLDAALRTYETLCARLEGAGRQPEEETTALHYHLRSPLRSRASDRTSVDDAGLPSLCLLRPLGQRPSHAWRLARLLVGDVTVGLCRTSHLRMTAPYTADQFTEAEELNRAAKTHVDYVVRTEILDHLNGGEKIVFMLHSVASRSIVWCDTFDVSDDLSVETYNRLARGVMEALVENVERAELERFELRTDPTSYVLFLKGQGSLSSLDLPKIRRGRQFLTRAYRQTPAFAPTLSAMARSFQLEWLLMARGDPQLLDNAELFARSAIEADPREARGYRELGFCFLYTKQFDRCLQQYRRAEDLSPRNADILSDFADALVHDGQIAEALAKIRRAIDLNPLCPDTYYWTLAAAHFFQNDYGSAIATIGMMREEVPGLRLLAAAYAWSGDRDNAERCRTRMLDAYPDMTVDNWAKIIPFRKQEHVDHYLGGLRRAGFR